MGFLYRNKACFCLAYSSMSVFDYEDIIILMLP